MLKEDDIVLCTVKKIEGTTVFVDIEGDGSGTIVFSEIAAGRIRNIREYVIPNKKIVCKVLKAAQNHIELSLRRITAKERDEVMDKFKKEKTLLSMLRAIIKEPEKVIEKIRKSYDLSRFIEIAKENPKVVSEFLKEEESKKFLAALAEKKEKVKEAKKKIIIRSGSPNGIEDIKSVLDTKEASVKYLGSSQFSVSVISKDFKEANQKLSTLIQVMEKRAKDKKIVFEVK